MDYSMIPSEQLHILGFVALAMLLGACVGFDRELVDRPAGLRTHYVSRRRSGVTRRSR